MKGSNHLLIRIAVALIIVLCITMIIELQLQMNKLNKQKAELERQVEQSEEKLAELKYKLSLPYDEDYAARVARQQLGYHFPDEILFTNDLYNE